MKNEQWKFEGDCTKCRRQKYCSKECKASRDATEKLIIESAVKSLTEKIMKVGEQE